ncbi:MAG: hypothetical protein COV34_01595 [Candidatus Zambryskibacteria bacterium CG10_big_fil_rev_8_21_14_0_10_42_12]|uniref:Uncharacterized protein n=1 Tax=Candidatus Zambryskibacteria bacterium CG10_big_fil_rev_8_21_14_0_10_42_12 TaxID=1975115 RepID=A0A2H0QXD2_9BACT|nr:MAG: hypothetical protein COV34_01595 [Candidatus Zambryskibacteria bacterium CG10_big_fil_rev_8_21_14_0_10_42_12]
MAIIWTFGVALCGIILIFANKLYELKHRKETFITRFFSRYDKTLERMMLRLYFVFRRIEDWVKMHTHKTFPSKVRATERIVIEAVSDFTDRFVHFWRGKKELLPRAKVSKFIASILEYRYHSERERKKLVGNGRMDLERAFGSLKD